MPRKRLNAYERTYDTRSQWLGLAGKVVVRCRVKSVFGTTTETGIGSGNDFTNEKNRVYGVNRAIDDAVIKHIASVSDKEIDDRNFKKPADETYATTLNYDKNYYGDEKGSFDKESMGIKSVKVLSIKVRYFDKGLQVRRETFKGKSYTITRKNGRFVKGGFVTHNKMNSTRADTNRYGYGVDSDDDPLTEYR